MDIVYIDKYGNSVRLTAEKLDHILLHKEMHEMIDNINDTLLEPDFIIESHLDESVRLFVRNYVTRQFGEKHLCVVVKYSDRDSFIITSYIARDLPKGEILWQRI